MEYAYGKSSHFHRHLRSHICILRRIIIYIMKTEIIRINMVLSNQIEGFLSKNLIDVLDHSEIYLSVPQLAYISRPLLIYQRGRVKSLCF